MNPGKFLFSLLIPVTLAGLLVVGCTGGNIEDGGGGGDPLGTIPISTSAPTPSELAPVATLAPTEVPATEIPESLPTREPASATVVPTEVPATQTPASPPTEEPPATTSPITRETVAYNIAGISPLANGYHYEGWAIIDGEAVSTGKFNVNDSGELVDLGEAASAIAEFTTGIDLSEATEIVVTIEPPGDTDATPSNVKYLAGEVQGDAFLSADLTVNHTAVLGDDYTGASGTFILATPTDDDESNETNGIWFINLSAGVPGPGLQLPGLPEGFEYQGWLILDSIPVSTGKFGDPAAADSGNPYSGPKPGNPFPGEDFLQNAPDGLTFPTDILGSGVVISIEPVPDDSPDPFVLKPLIGVIPEDAESLNNYPLENQATGFPAGVVDIK